LDPKTWGKDEVAAYLELIELGDYKKAFRDNDIKGTDLLVCL
jgi:hypothetical protein